MGKYQFEPTVMRELERLRVPLAVYQFLEKRVVTIMLSDGFCELFGFDDKNEAYYMMDNDMYRDAHPDDAPRIADEAFRFATEGGKYEVVYRTLTNRRDSYKIIHAIGEHVYTDDGVRLAYVWYTDEGSYTTEQDTRRKLVNEAFRRALQKESLIKSLSYDYLTGLPEMSYFFELADEWRRPRLARQETVALLFMDLCGMKYFNRKYGFAEGDNMLRRFANILKKEFSNENCSRFGSDHFCVFTGAADYKEKLESVFEQVRCAKDGKMLPVRVGVFIDTDGSLDISAECDRAKYACDTMRNTYLSRFRVFDDTMLRRTETTQYIIDHLDKAIAERQIEVYCQPIIRSSDGEIGDVEVLSRWNDPDRGMLMPNDYIPVLEKARLIYKLDLYMVERVLARLKQRGEDGLRVVPVSVNLSRTDFDVCDIVEEVRRLVDLAGVDRELINIEVTESSVGEDFEYMKAQIERFRELGFRVWMDDFGSGYSSLHVLQSIRFDYIKFDMSFMRGFDRGDKSKIILTELIRLAQALDIDTVCEGVETEEQVNFLRNAGCTRMQGYYFCRPIPLPKMLEQFSKE